MFEIDQTYLAYELAYRAERMRGERPAQLHGARRSLRGVRRRDRQGTGRRTP